MRVGVKDNFMGDIKGGLSNEYIQRAVMRVLEMYISNVSEDTTIKCVGNMHKNLKEKKMATDKLIAKELKSLAREWKKAKAQTGFLRPDDGDFVAKLVGMNLSKSTGASGRLQIQSIFKIVDGEQKGKEASKFDGLDKNGIPFFKGFAEIIGFEVPEDISELPASIEEFIDENESLFNIQLKTKGEYQNLYVKGVSEYEEGEEEEEEEDEEEEDEKPKSKKKTTSKKSKKKKDEEEEEDEDEEEEEEDEEDEEPPKKRGKKRK